jgi:DNA primase
LDPSIARFKIALVLEEFGAVVNANTVKICCPFHDDSDPSAVCYEYYFKCFACGVQGDAVRLLHDQGGLDWRESYAKAAELAGEPEEQAEPIKKTRGGPRVYTNHRRW